MAVTLLHGVQRQRLALAARKGNPSLVLWGDAERTESQIACCWSRRSGSERVV